MKREIIKIGNEILRQVAKEVENNEHTKQVVQDLKDTLITIQSGAGLAAPQIGESVRIFSTRNYRDKKTNEILIFINPEIVEYSKELVPIPDGCLSIPMVSSETERSSFIKVKYFNEDFNQVEEELEGFQSVVFQHEYDHLDGILFLDRLSKDNQEKLKEFFERKEKGENIAFMGDKIIEININFNKNVNK